MKKKLNSKLLLKKKTVSKLNDSLNGGNQESTITIWTIFITKYCGTANCSAACGGTTHCQTKEETCLICYPDS